MTMASTTISPSEQDLSAIKTGEWPDREFPLGPRERPTRRQVIFKQSVLNDIYGHGRSAPDIEVCGVLVGNVYHDAMGPFVFVEACIRGNFSTGRAAQVTFTAKTWAHIQDVMDKSYPEMRILGWYHTHPGHGIFLSDMDLFIHKNFFSLPWHLAFVFDPQNQEEGLFAWRTGNMAIESFVVQKDASPTSKVARRIPEPAAPTPAPAPTTSSASSSAEDRSPADNNFGNTNITPQPESHRFAASPEVAELALRIQILERRQRWVTAALAMVVLVAVAWPIVLSAMSVLRAPEEPTAAPTPVDKPAAVVTTPQARAHVSDGAIPASLTDESTEP
jgi:proteasome lid subunit RPN8/RPN11